MKNIDWEELVTNCGKQMLPEDCNAIYSIVKKFDVKTVLEIGSGRGNSTVAFALALAETGGHVHSVDAVYKEGRNTCLDKYGVSEYATFYIGRSPWIHKDKLSFLDSIDFLFIDGDHSFLSVIRDFTYWEEFVVDNGIIGFHDWNCGSDGQNVINAVSTIINNYNMIEIGRVPGTWSRGSIFFKKSGELNGRV